MHDDDLSAELVQRAKNGDRDAYDELFANAAERLQLFIRIRLGQGLREKEQSLDLLQETYLAAHQAFDRFEREARSLARLRHRHIVSVHEIGHAEGFLYFTMDLIDGRTLGEHPRRRPGRRVRRRLRTGARPRRGCSDDAYGPINRHTVLHASRTGAW